MAPPTRNTISEISNQRNLDGPDYHPRGKNSNQKRKKIHRPFGKENGKSKSKSKRQSKKNFEERRTIQQKSDDYARFLCLVVLQNIARHYNQSIYSYSMMLQILLKICFSADCHTVCKVAIISKYASMSSPRISETLSWSQSGVKIQEVVNCQAQILTGINFKFIRHDQMSYNQIRGMCYQYQKTIFQKRL